MNTLTKSTVTSGRDISQVRGDERDILQMREDLDGNGREDGMGMGETFHR